MRTENKITRKGAYEQFPHLHQFFGSYFHQDWNLEAPDTPGIVSLFAMHSSVDERRRVIDDIERLQKIQLGEEMLAYVFDSLGCCYYAPGEDITYTNWINQVRKLLQAKL